MKKSKLLVVAVLVVCVSFGLFTACKKGNGSGRTLQVGVLSYLNFPEEEYSAVAEARRDLINILLSEKGAESKARERMAMRSIEVHYYDTLDAMIMALQAGEIDLIDEIPNSTAKYLCHQNKLLKMSKTQFFGVRRPGKDVFARMVTGLVGNGFSFMMQKKNVALRDSFDDAIMSMKRDGTFAKLVKKHIIEVCEGGEIVSVVPAYKHGRKTIKVAVTGALPPMDFVAPDGTFAGFNTAILAEIGKRLDKNITIIQVDSVGRATALASGTVDVVFWTRGASEWTYNNIEGKSKEEFEEMVKANKASFSAEESAAIEAYMKALPPERNMIKDMPDDAICTYPYFSELPDILMLKKTKL